MEKLKGVKWNGIGKEYGLNNELLYDGEYKNGKGKSYYEKENIKLKFEFEYLGPQKIKSKKYYKNAKLQFESERDGEKDIRKEYYENGKLKFDGEYLKRKIWNGKGYNNKGIEEYEISKGKGNIKEFNNEGILLYEGEYLDGLREGKGKEYYPNGNLKYDGCFSRGAPHGQRKEYDFLGRLIFEGWKKIW